MKSLTQGSHHKDHRWSQTFPSSSDFAFNFHPFSSVSFRRHVLASECAALLN